MQSHIIAFVPNSVVKDILTQPDPNGRRGRWIVVLLEYDLEIKPTKLIKGMGLAKLMAQPNLGSLGINFIDEVSDQSEKEEVILQISEIFSNSPWYQDIVYVLQHLQVPPDLAKDKARHIKLKAVKFCIIERSLYWKYLRGILLNCLVEEE